MTSPPATASPTPAVTAAIQRKLGADMLYAQKYRGQEIVVVKRERLLELAQWMKDEPSTAFDVLMDLSAVDYLRFGKSKTSSPTLATPSPLPYFMEPKPSLEMWRRGVSNDAFRFDVVYQFYSTKHNRRVRVRVPVALADPKVPSVTSLWAAADWFERETWDMYGIVFTGHPNLKRILMYEEFKGHPLRKDYPINRRQPLIGPLN